MSLLISGVFRNKVEVFAADDKCSMHFGGNHLACEDSTADGDHASKRTLFIYRIRALVIFRFCEICNPGRRS